MKASMTTLVAVLTIGSVSFVASSASACHGGGFGYGGYSNSVEYTRNVYVEAPSVAPIFAPGHSMIVVLPGDSWFSISSREYGNSSVWSRIAEFNGLPQNLPLTVGMQLRLPVINPNGAFSISSAPAMVAPGQGFAGGFQGQPQGFPQGNLPQGFAQGGMPQGAQFGGQGGMPQGNGFAPQGQNSRRSPRLQPAARPDGPAARSAPRCSVRWTEWFAPRWPHPVSSSLRRTASRKPVSSVPKVANAPRWSVRCSSRWHAARWPVRWSARRSPRPDERTARCCC